MNKKIILAVDFVVVVVSLMALVFIYGYVRPLVIAPIDNFETSKADVLFSVGNANQILIDDNPQFSSPESFEVQNTTLISLEPGFYYWRAVGVVESEVRTLTINSRIDLKFKNTEEGYGVINAGNTGLSIQVYNGTELVGSFKLGVGEKSNVNGTKIEGSQNG